MATVKIVRFHELGGPDVLKLEDMPLPEPGKGEVRLRVEAIGLNRAEVMFREGRYLVNPTLPSKLGYEASCRREVAAPAVQYGAVVHGQ
jgi:NADPH:quinone reductase-like Zn-dependent oxidoreductase